MLARRFGRSISGISISRGALNGLRRTLLPAITNINTMFSSVENIRLIASADVASMVFSTARNKCIYLESMAS